MITQRYNLNLIPDRVPVIVNCSQYDANSRTIEMVIYDGSVLYSIPNGATATVRGTKSDNTGFEYSCTISGSIVSFDIKDQMTIFSGKVPCEIRFVSNSDIIGTCNFLLNVEETPLDPEITISQSDLPLLERVEQNAIRSEDAADRSEDAADRAESLVATAVKSVNSILPDSNGNVDVDALPSGGTTGQYLVKQSSTDGDADWQTLPTFVQTVNNVAPTNGNVDVEALPSGGTQGQVLTKQSSTDGDADWEDIDALPSGGTVGQVLTKQSSTDGDASWQTPTSGGTIIYDDDGITSPIIAYNELTFLDVASGVDTVLLGIDMDLLWTNGSVSTAFASQTLNIDSTDYSSLLIIAGTMISGGDASSIVYTSYFVKKGNAIPFSMCVTQHAPFFRNITTLSDSQIVFANGYYTATYNNSTTNTVYNYCLVPYQIYGIR